MIPYGRYEGNRSEYLAWFALSSIGFTIPIERQSDHFNVDFLVHLAERVRGKNAKGNPTDNIVATGKSFQIQVKSDDDPVVIDGQEAVQSFLRSTIPFFLGVVSKKSGRISIYPTTTRLCFYHASRNNVLQQLTLVPGKAGERLGTPDWSTREIRLGMAIAEFDLDDLEASSDKTEQRQLFLAVMKTWTEFEERVIAWTTDGLPFGAFPPTYETNKPLDYDTLEVVHTNEAAHLPQLLASLHKNARLATLYFQTILTTDEDDNAKQVQEFLGDEIKSLVELSRQVAEKTGKLLGEQGVDGEPAQTN